MADFGEEFESGVGLTTTPSKRFRGALDLLFASPSKSSGVAESEPAPKPSQLAGGGSQPAPGGAVLVRHRCWAGLSRIRALQGCVLA